MHIDYIRSIFDAFSPASAWLGRVQGSGLKLPRKRKMVVSALNLAMAEPHSPARYVRLIQALFGLRRPIRTRGDQHLVFSSIDRVGRDTISGTLGRFTEIDMDLPWFDLENLDEASEDSVEKISIPMNLRPNYRPFYFRLDGSRHLFAFEQYGYHGSVSPNQVLKFMSALSLDKRVINEFGSIEINLVQSEEALDQIFALRQLRRLRITYTLPNPDDLSSFEATMQKRLRSQHIQRQIVELEADATHNIEPNVDTKLLARSALSNGNVEGTGYNLEDALVTLKSAEHPRIEAESYDPEAVSERDAFLRAARRLSERE